MATGKPLCRQKEMSVATKPNTIPEYFLDNQAPSFITIYKISSDNPKTAILYRTSFQRVFTMTILIGETAKIRARRIAAAKGNCILPLCNNRQPPATNKANRISCTIAIAAGEFQMWLIRNIVSV